MALDFFGSLVLKCVGGLAFNFENENDIWVYFVYNVNDGAKVFYLVDGGQIWENVMILLLDGYCIYIMFFQVGMDGMVYIGIDKVVFYWDEIMEDWVFYNEGLLMCMNINIF